MKPKWIQAREAEGWTEIRDEGRAGLWFTGLPPGGRGVRVTLSPPRYVRKEVIEALATDILVGYATRHGVEKDPKLLAEKAYIAARHLLEEIERAPEKSLDLQPV